MVVDELSSSDIDRVFQALADATRRDIVFRAIAGEHSVSGLAEFYAMSFAAVQKHVAVLERASLVTKEKRGREQVVRISFDAVRRAQQLLDEYEVVWRQRVDRIEDLLAEE